MQSAAPLRLTQMPPRPTCSPSAFSGADCQDRWHIYNQAAHQVAAPLQQQIEDLNKLTTDQQAQIKKLSDQIEADSVVAIQAKLDYATAVRAKTAAHTEGLEQGIGIGVGATLILCGLIFAIRRLNSELEGYREARSDGLRRHNNWLELEALPWSEKTSASRKRGASRGTRARRSLHSLADLHKAQDC